MSIGRGTQVRIVRGKHAGTSGTVFWFGADRYRDGLRLGVRGPNEDTLWVHESLVEVIAPSAPSRTPWLGPTFHKHDVAVILYQNKVHHLPVSWVGAATHAAGQRLGLGPVGEISLWLNAQDIVPNPPDPMPAEPVGPLPQTLAACMRLLESVDERARLAGGRGLLALPEPARAQSADGIMVNGKATLQYDEPSREHADPSAIAPDVRARIQQAVDSGCTLERAVQAALGVELREGRLSMAVGHRAWPGMGVPRFRLNTAVAAARAAGLLGASLDLRDSTAVDVVALSGLRGLEALSVTFCTSLRRLVADLPDLRSLHAHKATSLTGLPGLEQAPLETLLIEDAPSLCALPGLPSATSVTLRRCGLRDLDALRGGPVEALEIRDCTALGSLAVLSTLRALRVLRLEGLPLQALPELPSLHTLEIRRAPWLADIRALSAVPSLRSLVLRDCAVLSDLSPIDGLPVLESVSLQDNPQLGDVSALGRLPRLSWLDLHGMSLPRPLLAAVLPSLERARFSLGPTVPLPDPDRFPLRAPEPVEAPPLEEAPRLTTEERKQLTQLRQALSADAASRVAAYELMVALGSRAITADLVRGLSVDAQGAVQVSESARRRAHLRDAEHRLLSALVSLRAAGMLDHVGVLDIRQPLSDLSILSGLPALRCLRLWLPPGTRDLSALAGLPALEELVVRPKRGMHWHQAPLDLSGLSGLSGLRRLAILGCDGTQDFAPLRALSGLEALDLSLGESALQTDTDLEFLQGMRALRHLRLQNRLGLSNTAALSALSRLQTIDLSGTGIESLRPLGGCTSLGIIWAQGCKHLEDVRPVLGLPRLRALQV